MGLSCCLVSINLLQAIVLPEQRQEMEKQEKVFAKYEVVFHFYTLNHQQDSEEFIRLERLLREHLSIVKSRTQSNLDEEQEYYLKLEVPAEIEQILETEGYFKNQIKIDLQFKNNRRVYNITIGLSAPTRIKDTQLTLAGEVDSRADRQSYYDKIYELWQLKPSVIFKEISWEKSKKSALQALQLHRYPLAKIVHSAANIDPKKHQAHLELTIDSGPTIYFGPIQVIGAQRYPVSIVKRLTNFKEGEVYDAYRLKDYQNNVEQEGHYSEVIVLPLLDQIHNSLVPVQVNVRERLRKDFAIELSEDSEDGLGAVMSYEHYDLFHRGFYLSNRLFYNRYEQGASIGLSQPKRYKNVYWQNQAEYFKGSKNGLFTLSWSDNFWYVFAANASDTKLGLQYYKEKLKNKQTHIWQSNHVLLAGLNWRSNHIQTLLRPQRGYYINASAATTLDGLSSSTSMQRYELLAEAYFTPWQHRYGTFLLRGQVGYIAAPHPEHVPDSLRFKLGGPGSVRGYASDSIGINRGNYVLGGRAKLAFNVEYQVPLNDKFSLAFFEDAGDVKDRFKDLHMKYGTGIGLRWFSMLAPLSFDIAYGHDRKKLGWHINLGTRLQ